LASSNLLTRCSGAFLVGPAKLVTRPLKVHRIGWLAYRGFRHPLDLRDAA
jgi:hypothetical protein